MRPLHVVAHLRGTIAYQSMHVMLDSLLQRLEADRLGLPAIEPGYRGPSDLPIPIARSTCGRVFLCSQGEAVDDEHELRWKNRRAPIQEMKMIGSRKINSINVSGGANRSYRIPIDTAFAKDDRIEWWCVGDMEPMLDLLNVFGGYLGHRRGVGLGRVMRWEVAECDAWPGFPVLRDGLPLRPLPVDWPGLRDDAERSMRCLLPPYWRHAEEELVAVPS